MDIGDVDESTGAVNYCVVVAWVSGALSTVIFIKYTLFTDLASDSESFISPSLGELLSLLAQRK